MSLAKKCLEKNKNEAKSKFSGFTASELVYILDDLNNKITQLDAYVRDSRMDDKQKLKKITKLSSELARAVI